MNRVHFCGVVIFALAMFSGRAPAQIAASQEPVDETTIPGDVQLVHWDVLLTQSGADAFNKVATPIKTDSKLYQGMSGSGFELRQSVADAIANNGTAGVSRNMAFAQTINNRFIRMQPAFFNYFNQFGQGAPVVRLNGQPQKSNDKCDRTPDGHMHLVLDESDFRITIMEGNRRQGGNPTQNSTGAIKYDGNLAPGDAVAFMAPFTAPSKTVYYQLNVWEAFKAPNSMMTVVQYERNAGWWCQNGPAGFRKWAGVAMAWEAQAPHVADDAPAEFIKKLDDDKEIRLVALCRPSDAPFCWWNGKGEAVSNLQNVFLPYDGAPPKGLWAMVQIRGNDEEFHRQSPATQPITDRYGSLGGQPFIQSEAVQLADSETEVTAQTAVGPWHEIGQLNIGAKKEIDGTEYSVSPQGGGNATNYVQVTVQFKPVPTDVVVAISAVGPDGKEAENQMAGRSILFPRGGVRGPTPTDGYFTGIPGKDIQYFRVCTRKLETVTFTGFATKPLTPVRTDYTADELAAAAKQAQDRGDAEQTRMVEDQRKAMEAAQKEWDAVQPDVKTPMGALKYMYSAAAKGDEKTLRGMMTAGNAQVTTDYLDKYAHSMTLASSNSAKAHAIFNAGQLDELSKHGAYFNDSGVTYFHVPWAKKENGDWEYPGLAMRKGPSGDYSMEISLIQNFDVTMQTKIIELQAMREEAIAPVLAQPNVTVAQVESAIQAADQARTAAYQTVRGR